jgi:hypothetical protein
MQSHSPIYAVYGHCRERGVNGVGNDILCLIVERKPERSRIEPRQIQKIRRSHACKHAVRAEIEGLAELENGLDVLFGSFAAGV